MKLNSDILKEVPVKRRISVGDFHIRVKDNVSHSLAKETLLKLSEKAISQFVRFTRKGHRMRIWAEKR